MANEIALTYFGTSVPDETFAGITTFNIRNKSEGDALLTLLEQPHFIAAGTTWALIRLLKEMPVPGKTGVVAPLFDLICIDEASQMLVAQGLTALAGLTPGARVLVAGDDRQLPPVQSVSDRILDGRSLGGSVYSFLKTAKVLKPPSKRHFG